MSGDSQWGCHGVVKGLSKATAGLLGTVTVVCTDDGGQGWTLQPVFCKYKAHSPENPDLAAHLN